MTNDKKEGEIISFGKVADSHMHARGERKLKKAQKAFKAMIRKKLKQDRIEARKKKKRKKR